MIINHNLFKNLREHHKEWTEAGGRASIITKHRQILNMGQVRCLPGIWRENTRLLVSGPKFSFQIKVKIAKQWEIKVL